MDRHEVVRLPPGFREPPRQKLVERLQLLQPPVLSRPDFTQVTSQFYEPGIPLGFRPPLPRQDLVNLGQDEQGLVAKTGIFRPSKPVFLVGQLVSNRKGVQE